MIDTALPIDELESIQFEVSTSDDETESSDSSLANVTPCTSPTNSEDDSSNTACACHGLNGYDVVCGRDRLSHSHRGNKRFRQIIQTYREQYQTANRREEKTRITGEIVSIVESSGGRFLKVEESSGEWVGVDSASIHEKVSHALRSARDPTQTKAKRKRAGDSLQNTSAEENMTFKKLLSAQKAVFLKLVDQHYDEDAACRIQLNPLFSVNSIIACETNNVEV